MENNICNSMILTSRRRHFYLVGQSKHNVGACGVNNQASAVLAGYELPFVAFNIEGVQRLVWPARSLDLNPIENVWDALGRQVAGRNYPPTNKNTLIRALTEEWDKLPQQLLDNVVQSMPDGRGYELVSSVQALVPQKFSVEEEQMHVKHVDVKSPHVGVMWKFGRGVIRSGIILVT
ncbi:hypothetical protein TNCV_4392641 [Trichonephila clavipes]|nr:hypothetical protein TNCV_4392641 [Trichonephila clavipes]